MATAVQSNSINQQESMRIFVYGRKRGRNYEQERTLLLVVFQVLTVQFIAFCSSAHEFRALLLIPLL